LSKQEVADIKRIPSRWCCIFKNFPQIIMTERNMWFVGGENEED